VLVQGDTVRLKPVKKEAHRVEVGGAGMAVAEAGAKELVPGEAGSRTGGRDERRHVAGLRLRDQGREIHDFFSRIR
jgi:hypothetical protein